MNSKFLPLIVLGLFVIGIASILLRGEPLFGVKTDESTVLQNLSSDKDQETSMRILKDAKMENALQSETQITLFAPTEEAYKSLSPEVLKLLNDKTDNVMQVHTANNHMVLGNYPTSSFNDGMILTTVNSEQVKITKRNNKWYVNDAQIVNPDVKSQNGVIHGINRVLLPYR